VKPRRPHDSTVSRRSRHSTVVGKPPGRPTVAHPPRRPPTPSLTLKSPAGSAPSSRRSARLLIDDDESTLVDVLDNLLGKGVVLNAEVILALANVDLIYLRLSVILCGAARVLPHSGR
jgi:gas vesicle structural protein